MIKVRCDHCKRIFKTAEIILETVEIRAKDKELQLTYYECPLCFKRHHVIIKDKDSLKIQEELDELVNRLRKIEKKGWCPRECLVQKTFKLKRRLTNYLSKLNNHYNGLSYWHRDDKEVTGKLVLPQQK